MKPISVMLVDDNAGFLRATTQFLEAQDGIAVIGSANGGRQALELAEKLKPQVILIDLAMADLPGLEAIPRLRDLLPGTSIVALTMMNTKGFRKAALAAGADGFVPKPKIRTSLLPTIHKISENDDGETE